MTGLGGGSPVVLLPHIPCVESSKLTTVLLSKNKPDATGTYGMKPQVGMK